MFSAVVLAAGRSSRMGTDKAMLPIAGQPAWARQRQVLREAGAAEVFLSARADQRWITEPEVTSQFKAVVWDAIPDCGPLGGISAVLGHAAHPYLAVLAIDLPAMEPSWFQLLWARAEAGGGVGVVGRRDGYIEPLAALYPRELDPLVGRAFAAGEHSLQKLLREAVTAGLMRVIDITPEQAGMFENRNEPRQESH